MRCAICDKPFIPRTHNQRYCSKECAKERQKMKSNKYKIDSLNLKIFLAEQRGEKYRDWQKRDTLKRILDTQGKRRACRKCDKYILCCKARKGKIKSVCGIYEVGEWII